MRVRRDMKFSQFIRENRIQIHTAMLIVGVVFLILYTVGMLPPETATTVTFSLIAYILLEISQNTDSYSRNKAYRQEVDLIPDLLKLIDERGARDAQLIQYSGRMVSVVVRKLLDKGAAVTLWIQDPEKAISQEQKERIESSVRSLAGELKVVGHYSFTAHRYHVPASIRGILIDEKILVIGWYTYEHVLEPDGSYPDDKVEISGHDRPCWILYEGTPEFTILKDMFRAQLGDFERNQKQKGFEPIIQISKVVPTNTIPMASVRATVRQADPAANDGSLPPAKSE